MSPGRLRALMIALLVVAAVASGIAGEDGGPFMALAFSCFAVAVAVFFRWRRAIRARVFDSKEKTSE
jgi:hypothetical protein